MLRWKFYCRYGDLTKQYEVPLSRMIHDILDDDHIQWYPPLIGHNTNFWPLLIWTLLPNLTFYLFVWGFHRTYATVAAYQQRTLTPPGTSSCPFRDFAFVLLVKTSDALYRWDIIPVYDNITRLAILLNLKFQQILVSIEHLQRVWHADRGRLLLRTPGPVPLCDLHVF